MKILNAYPGIGGNRLKWIGHEVTAVELDPEIAGIYQEYFPDDKVIVDDAHEYILNHYKEFDFIWTSRPCQSHSRARMWTSKGGRYPAVYPDLRLYEEIIFLKHFADKIKWVSENVIPYYEPLIPPTAEIGRHYFWSNFEIPKTTITDTGDQTWAITSNTEKYGFSVKDRDIKHRKDQIIRNLVNPDIGEYILNCAMGIKQPSKQLVLL